MRLLLVNDDGYDSAGIQLLAAALEPLHELWIVAPDGERSCSSHSANLRDPVRLVERGERRFACSGSPVDCVILARRLGIACDAVVSGINAGPNIGTDVVFSGTAAAARQAAMHGLPGFALSVDARRPPFPFGEAAARVDELLGCLVPQWRAGMFYNVNFPAQGARLAAWEMSSLSTRVYSDFHDLEEEAGGLRVFRPRQGEIATLGGPGTDADVLARGRIAVSAVAVHPSALDPALFSPPPRRNPCPA